MHFGMVHYWCLLRFAMTTAFTYLHINRWTLVVRPEWEAHSTGEVVNDDTVVPG